MEILRFLKWQWNRFDKEEVALISVIILLIAWITYGVINSLGFLVIFMGSLALMAIAAVSLIIVGTIHKQWIMYSKQKEQEALAIVNKLRGRPY